MKTPFSAQSPYSCHVFPAVVAFLLAPAVAAEETGPSKWTVGLGGGVQEQYSFWTRHYSFGTFSESMEAGWFASASVQRAISNSVALRGEVSYLRYSERFGIFYISPPAPQGVRIAEIPALAFGVRLQSGPNSGRRGSFFLDLLPAVFVAHWTEGVKYGDEWGSRERGNKVAAGIILGAGMHLPISARTSVDFGPRYTRTGSLGWTQSTSSFTPEESEGLNDFGLAASITRDW
jgi:hypothetical protein